jgi:hypothetical protein
MYTEQDYLYGWLFYLLGVLIVLGCGWWMTSSMRSKEARQLLRLSAVVIFTVPWYASPDLDYLAPAWLIAAYEGIFERPEAFWRAGAPLLTALTIVIAIALIFQLIARFWGRGSDY